jgi:hypothetical protein
MYRYDNQNLFQSIYIYVENRGKYDNFKTQVEHFIANLCKTANVIKSQKEYKTKLLFLDNLNVTSSCFFIQINSKKNFIKDKKLCFNSFFLQILMQKVYNLRKVDKEAND